jgi:hypothetical protein
MRVNRKYHRGESSAFSKISRILIVVGIIPVSAIIAYDCTGTAYAVVNLGDLGTITQTLPLFSFSTTLSQPGLSGQVIATTTGNLSSIQAVATCTYNPPRISQIGP